MFRKFVQSLFFILCGILVFQDIFSMAVSNYSYILMSKVYSSKYSSSEQRVAMISKALSIECLKSSVCSKNTWQSDNDIIELADRIFFDQMGMIRIISDSAKIPIEQFLRVNLSNLAQPPDLPGVLYGTGHFQLRLFILADTESCWQLEVMAIHDAPAPVELELWIDEDKIGDLVYDKGDQSWELLSIYSYLKPNAYQLQIKYVNDYFDTELSLDRNAYVDYVVLNQAEAVNCENN